MLAIIPMKAHSERVPNKNIREFNGKPLFYWIFSTISQVDEVSTIVLDTDSSELALQVTSYFPQVKVSLRPDSLQGDLTSVNRLIEYVISQFPNEMEFLQTHSTNPCLSVKTVKEGISEYFEAKKASFDSLFTVNQLQTRFYSRDGSAINHDPVNLIRTQDLEPYFEENSNLYIFNRVSFENSQARIGTKPKLKVMNSLESSDIDTEVDFTLAEIIHQKELFRDE